MEQQNKNVAESASAKKKSHVRVTMKSEPEIIPDPPVEEQLGGLASLVEDEEEVAPVEGGAIADDEEEEDVGDDNDEDNEDNDENDDSSSIRTEELLAMDTTYLSLNEFLRSSVTGRNITDVLEELLEVVKKSLHENK